MIDRSLRALAPVLLALSGIVLVLELVAIAFGEAPITTLRLAAAGTWGTPYGVGQVLFKATPLIFTGISFEIAMRAGLFNIGGEGQLAAGSIAGAWIATKVTGLPAPIAIAIALFAAMLAGALVALPPAAMRARLGVHEIITTIMMNRIVEISMPVLLVAGLGARDLRTADVAAKALVPKLDRALPGLAGSAASAAFPIAIAAAFLLDLWMRRSRAGREIGFVGSNPDASRAEGIAVPRRLFQSMLISGALAGLVVLPTVLGYKGYFELGLGAGAGFAGIAVALLGRGTPLGIVLAAILLGTLEQAGLVINAHVPREAMSVLEALIILLVAIGNRMVVKEARA